MLPMVLNFEGLVIGGREEVQDEVFPQTETADLGETTGGLLPMSKDKHIPHGNNFHRKCNHFRRRLISNITLNKVLIVAGIDPMATGMVQVDKHRVNEVADQIDVQTDVFLEMVKTGDALETLICKPTILNNPHHLMSNHCSATYV